VNDVLFFNNFAFNEFRQNGLGHTDNSCGAERHYLGFMKKGSALIATVDTELVLKEGDMFYIPKGLKYHSWWNTGGEGAVYDYGLRALGAAFCAGQLVEQVLRLYAGRILDAFGKL
jgi:hypothetical protein